MRANGSAKLSCKWIIASTFAGLNGPAAVSRCLNVGSARTPLHAAKRIDHHAAAERALIGLVADDEAIALQRRDRLVKDQLRQRTLASARWSRPLRG